MLISNVFIMKRKISSCRLLPCFFPFFLLCKCQSHFALWVFSPYVMYAELQTYKHKVSHKRGHKVLQRTLKCSTASRHELKRSWATHKVLQWNNSCIIIRWDLIFKFTMNTCVWEFEYSHTFILISLFWFVFAPSYHFLILSHCSLHLFTSALFHQHKSLIYETEAAPSFITLQLTDPSLLCLRKYSPNCQ